MSLFSFFPRLRHYSRAFGQRGSLMLPSARPTSARCCSEIKRTVLEKPSACSRKTLIHSHSPPHPPSPPTLSIFFSPPGFEITQSKGIEWAATCEQLQMPQCQHAWPRATLFAVMERESDWTARVPGAPVACNGLSVKV